MTMSGADADELDRLAVAMRDAGSMLRRTEQQLTPRLNASIWDGANALRFRETWNRVHRRSLVSVGQELERIAQTLQRQAQEQRAASGGGASAMSGGVSSAERSRPSSGSDAAIRRRFGPRVDRIEIETFTAEATVGEWGGVREIRVVKEFLEDGSVRVTTGEVISGSIGAGVGAGVQIGDIRSGGGASAAAFAGLVNMRTSTFADATDAEQQATFGWLDSISPLGNALQRPMSGIHGLIRGSDHSMEVGVQGGANAAASEYGSWQGKEAGVGQSGSRTASVGADGVVLRGSEAVSGQAAARLLGNDFGGSRSTAVQWEVHPTRDGAEVVIRGDLISDTERRTTEMRVLVDRSTVDALSGGADLHEVIASHPMDRRTSLYAIDRESTPVKVDAFVGSAGYTRVLASERLLEERFDSVP